MFVEKAAILPKICCDNIMTLTVVRTLLNLSGLPRPSSSSSDMLNVRESSSMSLMLERVTKQREVPTSLTQSEKWLSHVPKAPSQFPPSQTSLVGLLYDTNSTSIRSRAVVL